MKITWPFWKRGETPAAPPVAPVAPVDVEAIQRAALEAGREAGREEGRAAALAEAKRELERLNTAAATASSLVGPWRGPVPGAFSYDNPHIYAQPQAPSRRPGQQIDLRTLRILADTYDVLRACIQHLKREVSSVPIQVVPWDESDKSDETAKRAAAARAWLLQPGNLGGVGGKRSAFEGALLEDVLVIGAGAVFYQRARGGMLLAAEVLDAATIRPKVDAYGWPGPGQAVYEQWVMGLLVADFTREELSFEGLGINARSYTPYPSSPVEWLVGAVNSALRADEWNRTWLTDGSTPSDMLALPETWAPSQVIEYAAYWDAMLAGDTRARQKTKFVPGGSQKVGNPTRKDQEFAEFELWLLRRTCAVFGVSPAAIGFAGEQYKVSQEGSMESASQFGAGVLLDYRDEQYTDLLRRLGYGELRCVSVTDREENAKERSERLVSLVGGAIRTPNEARKEEGLDPIEGGDTLFVPSGLRPIDQALEPPEPPTVPGQTGPASKKPATERSLRLWRRKALGRLERGQSAACEFVDDALPAELRAAVESGLPGCTDADSVRALFAALELE